MKILATSAMSGPYSISGMARKVFDREVKVSISPVFLALALHGMHETYEDFPRFKDLLLSPYAESFPDLMKQGKFREIQKSLPKDISKLFDIPKVLEIIDDEEEDVAHFWEALKKNDVDDFVPNAPLLMIHSSSDEVIPFVTAEESYQKFLKNKAPVTFIKIEEAKSDHVDTALPAFLKTARFFKSILSEIEEAKVSK